MTEPPARTAPGTRTGAVPGTGEETASVPETIRLVVPPEAAGERVDRLLADSLAGRSRSYLKRLIEEGCLSVEAAGGQRRTIVEPSRRVKPGETYLLAIPAAAAPEPAGEAIPLAVVYEDDHLIVVDKPAGLVVHPAPGNPEGTLVNALIAHCGDSLKGIGGVRRPGIVHRLDKDTSGLMVAAKTADAHESLTGQFAARTIEREYAAFVWGAPHPASGEIAGNIGRSPRNRKKMAVLRVGGRAALTRYATEARYAGGAAALLSCWLATGRTHQIRVHLAHIGHPVIGDPVYGGGATRARRAGLAEAALAAASGLGRQALHARLLGFVHPATGAAMRFGSPLPDDLAALADALKKYK